MSGSQHGFWAEALLDVARDLTAPLAHENRYARLLEATRRMIPCDATCLMRLERDTLVPLASYGLRDEAMARRFPRSEHPRLDLVLSSPDPIVFPSDSPLPDPFDDLLASALDSRGRIHSCTACRLTDGSTVIGVLAADALAPGLFDALDRRMLSMLAALASAAMRTIAQFDALEEKVERRELLVGELQRRAAMSSGGEILGTCPAMQRLREEIALVAPSHLGVLITGETGVGKALVAHSLHQGSSRRNEAMVHVNCAALPESLVESELFGHVAGAFTGAQRARAGKFEIADGGTLFLDEIGELPPAIQAKLLHVLEHGRIQRVGSDLPRRVDVRVVAATNRDLPIEVATGRFRSDLYHRLAVYPIHVPPLRDRREDIPQLVTHFAELSRRKNGFGPIRVSEEALARLAAADWPGNVRELANVIDRAVLRASRNLDRRGPHVVRAEHVDADGLGSGPTSAPAREDENGSFESGSLHARIDGFRRAAILAAVEDHRGSWAAAARSLGMDRSNLHHLAKRLGLIR